MYRPELCGCGAEDTEDGPIHEDDCPSIQAPPSVLLVCSKCLHEAEDDCCGKSDLIEVDRVALENLRALVANAWKRGVYTQDVGDGTSADDCDIEGCDPLCEDTAQYVEKHNPFKDEWK